MANLGLPGLCGFIGEVMVLIGSFQAAKPDSILMKFTNGHAYPAIMTLAIISCFGVILTAGYMLWTIQRVFFGPEKNEYKAFPEVDGREVAVLTPLTIMALALGILPTVMFFVFTQQTVKVLFQLFT
jgi:NADH-quinone oxidoreductase subunit M